MSSIVDERADPAADAYLDGPFLLLPGASFQSIDEYAEFRRQHAELLATRAVHDRSLASIGPEIVVHGSCGLCLRPATYRADTQGGERVDAGLMPVWRQTLACDCEHRLVSHERAALQYALGNLGVQPWYHALVLGRVGTLPAVLDGVLACAEIRNPFLIGPESTVQGRLRGLPGRYQLILMHDALHRVHDPAELLADCAAALTAGGTLVFTTQFHPDSAHSVFSNDPSASVGHRLGWDILRLAVDAGFSRTTAYLYWSEEFGYLGGDNFIFAASL